jgi:hypothetical protein
MFVLRQRACSERLFAVAGAGILLLDERPPVATREERFSIRDPPSSSRRTTSAPPITTQRQASDAPAGRLESLLLGRRVAHLSVC